MSNGKRHFCSAGFTIIELIVVIAIITVLAGVIITQVNIYIIRARAAKIAGDFRNIEIALRLLKAEQSLSDWPRDANYPSAGYWDSSINEITGLRQFLGNAAYTYDNDGDTMVNGSGCTSAAGVNIVIGDSKSLQSVFNVLDDTFDNGDGNCSGKIRYYVNIANTHIILYTISVNETIN
jgi:prepilin-type N-terminal cleavage/methylation domain-containing protein